MANVIITPNMSLPTPTPGQDPGPDYGTNNNQAFTIIDSHDHTPGNGVQITPLGLNININLNVQNNDLTNLAGLNFTSPASSAATTRLYTNTQSGGGIIDLFYNDGAGNVIPLTKAGVVNATAASIPGESFSGGTFTWKQGTGSTVPANFDIGGITLRPNIAATTFGVTITPPVGISSSYAFVLPSIPSVQSFLTYDNSGNVVASWVPDNASIYVSSNVLQVKPQGITQGLLAPRSTGTTVAAGGVAVSASCGNYVQGNTTFTPITNLSVTITTTGRPVMLALEPDGSGNDSSIQVSANLTNTFALIYLNNGATPIIRNQIGYQASGSSGGTTQAVSSVNCLDMTVNGTPGTYTYTATSACNNNSTLLVINYAKLVAYEI